MNHYQEFNALGQIGEKNANKKQGDEQDASGDNNPQQPEGFCPYCSVRGAVILIIGLAGIVVGMVILWHGLRLYFGKG